MAVAADYKRATDEQLLERYRNQADLDALERLVHRYERELYAYLWRYLRDPGLADEVFQTTFMRIVERTKSFEAGRKFRPWLYSIATHAAIDALRHRGRRSAASLDERRGDDQGELTSLAHLVEDPGDSPPQQLIDEERRRQVRSAVDALPETLRSVLLLTYFQGLTFRETAEALGIPLGTVKSRMHAALARLGLELRDHEIPEAH